LVFLCLKIQGRIHMVNNKYEIKTNSIQKKIFQYVDESPGIRYREFLRIT